MSKANDERATQRLRCHRTVQVSSPGGARGRRRAFPAHLAAIPVRASCARVRAISSALFAGRLPATIGVDTVYHDRQHTPRYDARAGAADRRTTTPAARAERAGRRARRRRASSPACSTMSVICGARTSAFAQRRRVHPHARVPGRTLPRGLPAAHRAVRLGAGGERDHPLHRLRGALRPHRRRGPRGPHPRAPDRHRRT